MAIFRLPEPNMSKTAAMRNKHWIKRLHRVDASQATGYAFVGDFEKFGATVEAGPGEWFLSYVEDRSASRLRGIEIMLYQVSPEGILREAKRWDLDGSPGWALKVRDEAAALVNQPAPEPEAEADPFNGETLLTLMVTRVGDDYRLWCVKQGCGTKWHPASGEDLGQAFRHAVLHATGHIEG